MDTTNEKPLYIMSPALFDRLCNVMGFNDHNGNTYQEHILIIFPNLDENTKNLILNTPDIDESLKVLNDNGINYTHEYQEN